MSDAVKYPQRRADDDFSVGELARLITSLTLAVERLQAEIRGLSTTYTPREVHDLALGGVKVDIRRIDETVDKLEDRIDDAEAETNRRFRQAVWLVAGSLLFPLTVALVIYVLTTLSEVGS
jgi:tetrahydromethanopterin S-methyltransferase subunit G